MSIDTLRPAGILASLLLAASVPAQVFVVRPNLGRFASLQKALDAAPAGAVVRLVGGVHGPVRVTRSVTIVGDPATATRPAPVIRSVASGSGGPQPPAIGLIGSGTESFTLAGVEVRGKCNGATWSRAGAGIEASGVRRILLVRCVVEGMEWEHVSGRAPGAPGILLSDSRTRTWITVSDTLVRASRAWDNVPSVRGVDGAAGILAPHATVQVVRGLVRGGIGADLWSESLAPPSPGKCPCAGYLSRGGPGVVAAELQATVGSVAGGVGGSVFWRKPGQPWKGWGRQPSGQPFVGKRLVSIPDGGARAGAARMGRPWVLSFPPMDHGVVLLGSLSERSFSIPGVPGVLLIDPYAPLVVAPVPYRAKSVAFPVPSNLSIAGRSVTAQTAEGLSIRSAPLTAVVTF